MTAHQNLQNWVGRTIQMEDQLHAQPAQFMQATLDVAPSLKTGDHLPLLWHWLYFLEASPASELGRDSHQKKGGFLPPVSLPRRMWAGGRFTFHKPLCLGQTVTKTSTIKNVVEKDGNSGKLCFVTVEHQISAENELAMTEEHDIVYREDTDPNAPQPVMPLAPDQAEFSEQITPTPVMLFRYSALTFNGHRIHYDVDYARTVEGYDGLLFHGPLNATLLVNLAAKKMGSSPKQFSFRGRAPISGLDPFFIEGRIEGLKVELWAKRSDGVLAMSATAEF